MTSELPGWTPLPLPKLPLNLAASTEFAFGHLLIRLLFKGYDSGVFTFEEFCRTAHRLVARFALDDDIRDGLLGIVLQHACSVSRPNRQGRPPVREWLAEFSAYAVELANIVYGAPRHSETSEVTAFEFVASFLREFGFANVTENTVEKARERYMQMQTEARAMPTRRRKG